MNEEKPKMQTIHLTPAEYVVYIFRGVRAAAAKLGRSPSAVSKWRKQKSEGGTEGKIPNAMQEKILSIAAEKGLDINERDLLRGRTVNIGDKR